MPIGPAPGTTLTPATIDERDTRFDPLQSQAAFYCNVCDRGPYDHKGGAFKHKRARRMLATNRLAEYLAGADMTWMDVHCWKAYCFAERRPIPEDVDFYKWLKEEDEDPTTGEMRATPTGCPAHRPTAETSLSQLLIPLTGEGDPRQVGTTLPVAITDDDRLGTKWHVNGHILLKCDRCPKNRPSTVWRHSLFAHCGVALS